VKQRPPIFLTSVLVALWLLLNDSVSRGNLLLGAALALVMAFGFRAIRPVQARMHRPDAAIRLGFRVLIDIVRSNIGVACIVLGLVGNREVRSGFLQIPVDLRDPHGLAVLAAIVTSTPGTVWAGLTPDGTTLTLHVLDLRDDAAWIHTIKDRYERPLMEIFE